MLITAGPTHEPIDAVRHIANHSSGRMGIALAEVAAQRGHPVTLLLGPTASASPQHSHITTRGFRTTADLQQLLAELWPAHSVLIMAAAVADYRPAHPQKGKDSLKTGTRTLLLEPTPDLLAEAAASRRPDQITVGFALEPTDRLVASARAKLVAKDIDAIVANPLQTIGARNIRATLLLRDGRQLTPPQGECSKREFAGWLLDRIEEVKRMAPSSPAAPGSR